MRRFFSRFQSSTTVAYFLLLVAIVAYPLFKDIKSIITDFQNRNIQIPITSQEWSVVYGDSEFAVCKASEGCKKDAVRELFQSPYHQADTEHKNRILGQRPPRVTWLGTRIPVETLKRAAELGANQLVLGWALSRHQIWVDGQLYISGYGIDSRFPFVIAIPHERIKKNVPLEIVISVENIYNGVRPDAFSRFHAAGFTTPKASNAILSRDAHYYYVRSIVFGLVNLLLAIVFILCWAVVRDRRHYLYFGFFLLALAARYLQFHLGTNINSNLYHTFQFLMIADFAELSTTILFVLSLSKVAPSLFKPIQVISVLVCLSFSLTSFPKLEMEVYRAPFRSYGIPFVLLFLTLYLVFLFKRRRSVLANRTIFFAIIIIFLIRVTIFAIVAPYAPTNNRDIAFLLLDSGLIFSMLFSAVLFYDFVITFKQSERAQVIAEISAQVYHDIKSPISALKMLNNDESISAGERREMTQLALNRIVAIAEDIKLSGKLAEAGERGAEVQICDVGNILQNVQREKLIEWKNTASPVQLQVDLPRPFTAVVRASEKELARIISNIFNNAKEAAATEIHVTAATAGAFVEVIIADNGRGIPTEILATLGSKGATFGKAGGTGLGLYHAMKQLKSWGGELKIQTSEVGTRVELILPGGL